MTLAAMLGPGDETVVPDEALDSLLSDEVRAAY